MKAKFLNLISFLEATEDADIFNSFKKMNTLNDARDSEIESIGLLCKKLLDYIIPSSPKFSGYILGAKYVGVVSEEFDILRFSNDTIINIELKSGDVSKEKIIRQLERHLFLLSSINTSCKVKLFTYRSDENILYEYDNGDLNEIDFKYLVNNIPDSYVEENLLTSLNDTSFIISPYSEPERFFSSQYFLNIEQERAREDLLTSDANYIALKGGPGTGKSLILFDVAKRLSKQGKKVLFIFCSKIDRSLISRIDGQTNFKFMDIVSIRGLKDPQFLDYDILIIDESQRLYKNQLERFLKLFKDKKFILTVDSQQTLRPEENKLDVQGIFEKNGDKSNVQVIDCLTTRVRTDIELATFIKKFFNKGIRDLGVMSFPKVNAVYFKDIESAKHFFTHCLDNEHFVSIEMPQYNHSGELQKIFPERSLDAFEVIGKEFEKVLLPLNERVQYDRDGRLIVPIYRKYPYLAENSLFQAITRTKKELLILIINNKELFLEIEQILTWKEYRNNKNISKRLKSLRKASGTTIEALNRIVKDYQSIEETGIIPSNKISKKLANFYSVSWQFIEGEPSELNYSDFEIAFRNKTKNYNSSQKKDLEQKLLDFLDSI